MWRCEMKDFILTVSNGEILDALKNCSPTNLGCAINKTNFSTDGNKYVKANCGDGTFGLDDDFTFWAYAKINTRTLLPLLLCSGNAGQGMMLGDTYYGNGFQYDFTGYGNSLALNWGGDPGTGMNNYCMTKDKTKLTLYFNGKAVATGAAGSPISFPNVMIGADGVYADRYSSYSIQEIGIVKRCITYSDFSPRIGMLSGEAHRLYSVNGNEFGTKSA